MIRYEIYSNVASSDQGLQAYPALQELADGLRAKDVEARFIRFVQREEGEINLASSQYTRGITVRGTSVKAIPPEASLKGLMTWLKTVTSRVDRGLHVELEHVRQTNGAGIVIAQALAAGQQAFISGLDEAGWARLTSAPDLTGQTVPNAMLESPQAQGEYLVRRTRPTGFWPMLNAVVELDILAPQAQQRCLALSKSHDPKELDDLPDPLVIAIGLVSDGLERQQKLVEQFADSVSTAKTSGELPMLFELITHDVSFPALLQALLPFTLEAKRRGIVNKRALVNEVRIGLANGQDTPDHLRAALLRLVVQARVANDPAAFLAATRLLPKDADTLAALAVPRKLFLDLAAAVAETAPVSQAEEQAQAPVPVALKQRVMELIVTLVHRAQYTQTFRDDGPPAAVKAMRDLLGTLVFDVFNIGQLRGLKSNVPARGVAKNLAERVPLAWGEMLKNMETLEAGLYPYAAVSRSLAERIAGKFKDAGEQKRVDELNRYLRGSVHLLRLTTYMLGRADLNAVSRQALLEAGRSLGLTVYESRDELRRDADHQSEAAGQVAIQGTVMLLQRDDSRLFPIQARPELIMLAYRYLVRTQLAQATRSFLSHKLNYLVTKHGSGLFEVLYQRLTWDSMVRLSRRQLWEILAESRVLDADRLKELGYRADQDARAAERENPWLARPQARADEPAGAGTLSSDSLEQSYRDAYNGFTEFVQRFPPANSAPGGSGPVPLRTALGVLFGKEEVYTPTHSVARPILAGTLEAEALGRALIIFLGENEPLLTGQEPEEAFELTLPGRLAALTLLKDRFTVTVGPVSRLLRLVPAPGQPDSGPQLGELDAATRQVAELFAPLVGGGPSSLPASEMHLKLLAQALPVLSAFRTHWATLLQVSTAMFIDQSLRETILKFIRPSPPAAKDLIKVPEEQVLCLAPSTFNQAKFHRVVTRVDRKDAYLTLSEMAGWLARLQHLREEQRFFRDLIGDIQAIIRSLNLSVFDAAYIMNFGRALNRLDQALNVQPEAIGPGELKRIQERARDISMMLRDMYEQESGLRMRDRWLNRIVTELKRQRSNARINFADAMWEAGAAAPGGAKHTAPGGAKDADGGGSRAEKTEKTEKDAGRDFRAPEFQTFSERVRQCVEFRQRMNQKQVIILSPANTQRALTLNVIDQLFRLKGLNLTVMVDTSSADSFATELLSRVPPHRLFDLNAL